MSTRILAAIGGIFAAALFTPPAHADVNDYLAYLRNHGVPFASNDAATQQGIQICTEGVGIGQLETKMGRAEAEDYYYAAQHYLCGSM